MPEALPVPLSPSCQAMAMGLPTIGTDWGPMLDFLHKNNSLPVGVRPQEHPELPGHHVAAPVVEELQQRLAEAYSNPDQMQQVGLRARQYVVMHHSEEKLVQQFLRRMPSDAAEPTPSARLMAKAGAATPEKQGPGPETGENKRGAHESAEAEEDPPASNGGGAAQEQS